MLHFRPVTPEDRNWVEPLLNEATIPLCSYNLPTLYCWQHVYQQEIARMGNRLIIRAKDPTGTVFLWPVGKGDIRPALQAMEEDVESRGEPFQIVGVRPYHLPVLQAVYHDRIEVIANRDGYDYLYEVDRLADLPVKKLHATRNQLRRHRHACTHGTS